MPEFSSSRERRLWTWALVVAVAIYSTADLARMLADALRESGCWSSPRKCSTSACSWSGR